MRFLREKVAEYVFPGLSYDIHSPDALFSALWLEIVGLELILDNLSKNICQPNIVLSAKYCVWYVPCGLAPSQTCLVRLVT